MNEEIDESEFFHQDFTTASEWEVFIARMEEIVREWRKESRKEETTTDTSTEGWCIKREKIPFADAEFTLSLFRRRDCEKGFDEEGNVMENEHDFALKDGKSGFLESCLAQWYGLEQYIVLSPVGSHGITSESKIKLLLSSANILVGNENLTIPVFVQIREIWQNSYLGVHETDAVRTDFSSVHLRKGPHHAQYLTGLLDIFRTKIMSPALDAIFISARLTYNLTEFGRFTWKQEMPDTDSDQFDSTSLCILPFGVTVDPLSTLILRVAWSQLPSHLVVDTENYTDFNPLEAPKWSVLANTTDQPLCLLSDCFSEFLQLLNNHLTIYDILGDFASNATPADSNPLDVLTEPKVPTISSVLKRAARNSLTKNRRAGAAPLSEDVLVPMLYFLFPDADESAALPYSDSIKERRESSAKEDDLNVEQLCKGFKTCKPDSLVWRVAIILAQALHNLGGSRALAHLWYEFTQEMRYRWEKSICIPGLETGFPDQRTCLLHQKLQMLNCCIERKKAREVLLNVFESADEASSSDDDDVFFDCSDKLSEDTAAKKKPLQPVGRLGKFGDLKLLKTGEQLYIPVTQEPVPKTEDQLEEDTDVLLKLGSNAEGSELRAKMMSASLLSDMESFKAANPGAVLEDFIRWYSPRDWIEDEGVDEWGQSKGHLSPRMLISDNTWVQVWETAKAIPANRQKRLFDDTREAEKVLHFLDSRTTSQIAEMLLAVLSHASICRLLDEIEQVKSELPEAFTTLRHLVKSVERLSRETVVNVRRYEGFVQEMAAVELSISQVGSLLYKFNPSGETDDALSAPMASLYAGNEVAVDKESKIAKRMLAMFTEAQTLSNVDLIEQGVESQAENAVFPQAAEREFVLRASAVRPKSYSTKCPQFMRAILSKNEFRLCGAFSQDITFF